MDRGIAGPCVVADFDADGFADIVEVFQSNGLIRRGKPGGFDPPAKCGALMGKPKSRSAYVADLDGDGLLDIFLIGGGSTPFMLQNRGGTKFEEVMRLTGESGYIIQPGAACAALGDYNNDTFVDIYAGYEEEPSQSFFNRGFRSFAINEQLKFKDDDLPGCEKGQAAMVWADFDGSGSVKLAVALAGNAEVEKAQGAGTAIAAGAKVYWDEAAKAAKGDAAGGANKLLGECLTAVGDNDAKVLVRKPQADLYFSRTDLGQADRPLFLSVPAGKDVKSAAPLVVRFYLEGRCLGARVAERFGPSALLGVAEPGTYTIKYRAADGKEVSLERDPSDKSGAPKPATGGPTAGPKTPGPVAGPSGSAFPMLLIGGLVVLAVVIGVVLVLRKKGTGGEQP